MEFFGRKKELEMLETLYRNTPSFVVLTGKRRIGKTELIKQFCRNKRSLYLYVDSNKSSEILLEEFEREIRAILEMDDYIHFDNFGEMLGFLFIQKEELVIAIDEFQRFKKLDPSFITELQRTWDMKQSDSKVMLIASGSAMGMMRELFIERGSPLFKRAEMIMNLRPFRIDEVYNILKGIGIKKEKEMFDLYCLFGGTIYYYRLIEKFEVKDFRDTVEKLLLDDLAPLRTEIRDILIEEFGKSHATYFEILSAMAMGKTTKKEIGDRTHISSTSLSPYIFDLKEILMIVDHVIPVLEDRARTKKGIYVLRDNFFRFYFRFIYRNMSIYQIGRYDLISSKIDEQWDAFKGRIIEDLALEYAARTWIEDYPQIGKYWDRKGNEIDILGVDRKRRKIFLMEVKLRELSKNESLRIIDNMRRKAEILPFRYKEISLGLAASKIKGREELEKLGHVTLTLDDIVKRRIIDIIHQS
ncbi:MAG: ATP-binding protein [Candidatus Thermoplasmatota archaeon]|nr:ATP-binding protein [Candidatus Thermoplasmatota archaeon]